MRITFLQEAKFEFLDAISYYESEQPLGWDSDSRMNWIGLCCGLLNVQRFDASGLPATDE